MTRKLILAWTLVLIGRILFPLMSVAAVSVRTCDTSYTTTPVTIAQHTAAVTIPAEILGVGLYGMAITSDVQEQYRQDALDLIDADSGVFAWLAYSLQNTVSTVATELTSLPTQLISQVDKFVSKPSLKTIPVLGPTGDNPGRSIGEFVGDPSFKKGLQIVGHTANAVNVVLAPVALARSVGLTGKPLRPMAQKTTIKPRITRAGDKAVRIKYPDGGVKDISPKRVKDLCQKHIPRLHPVS